MTVVANSAERWLSAAIGCSIALALVWPVTHSSALRNFFMYGALIALALGYRHWRRSGLAGEVARAWRGSLYLLGALSIWLLLQGLIIAPDRLAFLNEYDGEWIRGLTALLLGGGLATALRTSRLREPASALNWLLLAMLVVLFAHLVDVLYLWWRDGSFPWQQTRVVRKRTVLSFHVNVLLGFWLSEIVMRAAYGQRFLPLSNWALGGATALSLVVTLSILTSNGTIGAVIVILLVTGLVAYARLRRVSRRKALTVVLLGIGLAAVLSGLSWRLDARWRLLAETIPIALDTTHNLAWLSESRYPWPKLPDGRTVEGSAYLRIAWFKVGVEFVCERPLGYGLHREVFDHLLRERYRQDPFPTHTHSALLDFTLGGGVPALLLWLAFIGTLLAHSMRAYLKRHEPAALMLLFLVIGFVTRSLVDINMRDHTLEQFFFFVGFLAPLLVQRESRPTH